MAEQSITRNTHTHGMFTVPEPQTHKHKPHPDLGHMTQIKCRMQHFALFPFPTCLPMGSHTTGGRAHPATGHNDTIPQNRTNDFPQLIPLVLTPGTQDLSLPPLAVPQHGVWPLRKEYKVLMDNPMLPSSTSYTLHLVEDLSQQPTNAKGLAGKT